MEDQYYVVQCSLRRGDLPTPYSKSFNINRAVRAIEGTAGTSHINIGDGVVEAVVADESTVKDLVGRLDRFGMSAEYNQIILP